MINDREVVLAAVQQKGSLLKLASEELRADKDIVLAALRQHGSALELASEKSAERSQTSRLQGNEEILAVAWHKLGGDKEVVLAAVHKCGIALRLACDSEAAPEPLLVSQGVTAHSPRAGCGPLRPCASCARA